MPGSLWVTFMRLVLFSTSMSRDNWKEVCADMFCSWKVQTMNSQRWWRWALNCASGAILVQGTRRYSITENRGQRTMEQKADSICSRIWRNTRSDLESLYLKSSLDLWLWFYNGPPQTFVLSWEQESLKLGHFSIVMMRISIWAMKYCSNCRWSHVNDLGSLNGSQESFRFAGVVGHQWYQLLDKGAAKITARGTKSFIAAKVTPCTPWCKLLTREHCTLWASRNDVCLIWHITLLE